MEGMHLAACWFTWGTQHRGGSLEAATRSLDKCKTEEALQQWVLTILIHGTYFKKTKRHTADKDEVQVLCVGGRKRVCTLGGYAPFGRGLHESTVMLGWGRGAAAVGAKLLKNRKRISCFVPRCRSLTELQLRLDHFPGTAGEFSCRGILVGKHCDILSTIINIKSCVASDLQNSRMNHETMM